MDKTLIQRGAERGAVMGAIFIVMFGCWVSSGNLLAVLLFLALFVAVPIIVYRMLDNSMKRYGGCLTFPALWIEGLIIMIGGSLLMSLAAFVFFRWIDPGFVVRQLGKLIEMYSGEESMAQYVEVFRRMIEYRMIPRPIEMAMSLMWSASFTGAVLSIVLAAVIRLKYRLKQPVKHDD